MKTYIDPTAVLSTDARRAASVQSILAGAPNRGVSFATRVADLLHGEATREQGLRALAGAGLIQSSRKTEPGKLGLATEIG